MNRLRTLLEIEIKSKDITLVVPATFGALIFLTALAGILSDLLGFIFK